MSRRQPDHEQRGELITSVVGSEMKKAVGTLPYTALTSCVAILQVDVLMRR